MEENKKEELDTQLLRRKLDLLLRAGKLLVESAADTNRIERNMKRIAAYMGISEDKLHLDISWTMLIVNVSDEKHSFSKFQKCEKHGVNMTVISELSKLSWNAIEQDYTIDEFEEGLNKIANKPRNYKHLLVALGASLGCGGFCKLFGCDWYAFLFAAICTFIGFQTRAICLKNEINLYISIAVAAFVSTCCAYLTTFLGLSATPYHPLVACALFIVPGVPLINFIDDMIDNHLLVGFTRFLNSIMIMGGMTVGITFALKLFDMRDVNISHSFSEVSLVPHDSYIIYALAAGVAAVGFSMIFNVEKRLLPVIAAGGIISVCTRNFVNFELGYGLIIGSFMGSFVVSIIAIKAVHWFRVPNHVLTIPSVIPMIPGVLVYRSMLGILNLKGEIGEVTSIYSYGVNAWLVILCISLGVAVPTIFARRLIAKRRRVLLQTLLAERRSRGKFIEW